MEASLKRVYVGGIGPSVTKTDLTERFGKFGKVDDVEIISRKDEQGNPIKTFAYLNINISELDLKKCISILNKTKWKGGVLQIEMAKENFLHKLEQERQQIKDKEKAKEQKKSRYDLVQSMAKSGVTDFQMKAAVPGTEIPNHKNWVVSKFGRVLPVLHLNGNQQSKIMKYDPSKFCHNIKKLSDDFEPVPLSQLTLKLEGGDDEVSKKRRGEFPEFKSPPKKKLLLLNKRETDNTETPIRKSSTSGQTTGTTSRNNTTRTPLQAKKQNNLQNKSINSMSDVEYDSEEELQKVLRRETSRGSVNLAEDSDLDIANDNFELSYTTHWADQKKSGCTTNDDNEYDSADTDEIITFAKTSHNNCDSSKTDKEKIREKDKSTPLNLSNKPGTTKVKSDDESEASGTDSTDSYSDEEYEAMMKNCYRLDLGMSDLEALANQCDSDDSDEKSEHGSESLSSDSDVSGHNGRAVKNSLGKDPGSKVSTPNTKQMKQKNKDQVHNNNSDAGEKSSQSMSTSPSVVNNQEKITKGRKAEVKHKKDLGTKQVSDEIRKKGIEPDDILSSILEDQDCEDEKTKQKKKNDSPVILPAFRGLGSLLASNKSADLQPSSPEISSVDNPKKKSNVSKPQTASSSSDTSSDESSSDSSNSASPAKPGISQNGTTKEQADLKLKQKQDNQKRLAAMEERRKERELQKQTIQGALLKMDSQTSKKSHIVFNSESELESEPEEDKNTSELQVTHTDVKVKTSTAKLFDSDNEEEKDDERFELKAQYEGRSGEKLMKLQSRFGTDERFKMDSRFLESSSEDEDEEVLEEVQEPKGDEEEEDLSAEKKKNLDILQRVLNINVEPQPPNKQTKKEKKFKDLNALHYDPTKDDHAAFETKTEEEKKESKAERKKKRLEAEKLPEVSKDTYHEVNVDFKEVFGATKPETTEEPKTPWDQEPEKMEAEVFSLQEKEEEPSGEFTFSFFGNNNDESMSNNEPYKIEIIKPAKVAWQEDPRFQDSSSEEDEEPAMTGNLKAKTSTQAEKSSIRFFFFIKDDERLKTGPKMFFKSGNTEQKDWEQRQNFLLEDCRKRHRTAKKKTKVKH